MSIGSLWRCPGPEDSPLSQPGADDRMLGFIFRVGFKPWSWCSWWCSSRSCCYVRRRADRQSLGEGRISSEFSGAVSARPDLLVHLAQISWRRATWAFGREW